METKKLFLLEKLDHEIINLDNNKVLLFNLKNEYFNITNYHLVIYSNLKWKKSIHSDNEKNITIPIILDENTDTLFYKLKIYDKAYNGICIHQIFDFIKIDTNEIKKNINIKIDKVNKNNPSKNLDFIHDSNNNMFSNNTNFNLEGFNPDNLNNEFYLNEFCMTFNSDNEEEDEEEEEEESSDEENNIEPEVEQQKNNDDKETIDNNENLNIISPENID